MPQHPADTPGGERADAPYAGLTPETILDALESVGERADGRLLALNSYENRVYQVYLESGSVRVLKFYRPQRWSDEQILEEHHFAAELKEAEVPVVAPVELGGTTLFKHGGFRFAVFERMGGRAPELDAAGVLKRIGALIGRIHAVGARRPFVHRGRLDIAGFGNRSRESLLASGKIPESILAAWQTAADTLLAAIREIYGNPDQHSTGWIRVHGDCHAGNILWTDSGGHFVDLDDCLSAPAVQDLWMLLSGDDMARTEQLRQLLEGYEQFREFDRCELRFIEALRGLRLIHYSAWLARRWNDPAFPAAFPWFNTQRYWQDRVLEMREQIAALSEPPLSV